MIEIERLSLNYGKDNVLTIPSLHFEDKGFYAIVGPSGCGKTSLINVLAGAIKRYDGEVHINGVNILNMKESEQLKFRQNTVSICYQDALLFDNLTVYENLNLKLAFYEGITEHRAQFECDNLLKRLKIYHLKRKKAKYLSGGEKQRVAIARALINNAPILIFDEPTSALDYQNAGLVFSLLKEYSSSALVIVVTHNKPLVMHYADYLIDLKYGKITSHVKLDNGNGPVMAINLNTSNPTQPPFKKLATLAKKIYESGRRRNLLATLTFSFCLTAICSLLVIVSTVSEGIRGTFTMNYTENTHLVSYDKKSPYPYREALHLSQVEILANRYSAKTGTLYLGNLENYFPSSNKIYFYNERTRVTLNTLSVNAFNHLKLIEDIKLFDLFGYRKSKLENDEVILMLAPSEIGTLYDHLGLRKGATLERLGEYIKNFPSYLLLDVANDDWGFEDQQLFRITAVIEGKKSGIVHSNPHLPNIIFEEKMQFRSNYAHSVLDEYPWTLKKIHFLYKKEYEPILIEEHDNPHVLLSRPTDAILGFVDSDVDFTNYICVYKKPNTYFPLLSLKEENKDGTYLLTNGALITFEEAMMVGFADNFLLSVSKEQLEEVISYDEQKLLSDNSQIILGPQMLNGHYSLSLTDGLTFSSLKEVDFGSTPNLLNEIVVSTNVFASLFSEDYQEKKDYFLQCAYPISVRIEGTYLIKDYKIVTLKITGLIKSNRNIIYHEYYWPLLFFKDMMHMDPFYVIPTGLITTSESIANQFKNHGDFKISKPYVIFSSNIEVTMRQITGVIYIVAASSVLMSLVVLFLVIHALIDDFNRHFSLLYLYGYSKTSILCIGLLTLAYILAISVTCSILITMLLEIVISRMFFSDVVLFTNSVAYLFTIIISLICIIPSVFLLLLKVRTLKITTLSKNNL